MVLRGTAAMVMPEAEDACLEEIPVRLEAARGALEARRPRPLEGANASAVVAAMARNRESLSICG
jgi:hypothetical protein